MEMKDLVRVAEKWAPVLASHLGGPVGGLVLSILSSAYGVDNKFDLKAIADQIEKNPYKLKELELQHQEKLGDMLVGLLEKVEGRAPNGLLWLIGVVVLAAFLGYMWFQVAGHG